MNSIEFENAANKIFELNFDLKYFSNQNNRINFNLYNRHIAHKFCFIIGIKKIDNIYQYSSYKERWPLEEITHEQFFSFKEKIGFIDLNKSTDKFLNKLYFFHQGEFKCQDDYKLNMIWESFPRIKKQIKSYERKIEEFKDYEFSILKNREKSNLFTDFQISFILNPTDPNCKILKTIKNVAICKKCNAQNEYMDYNPNYICYSCKH